MPAKSTLSQERQDALDALISLKIPRKEAEDLHLAFVRKQFVLKQITEGRACGRGVEARNVGGETRG